MCPRPRIALVVLAAAAMALACADARPLGQGNEDESGSGPGASAGPDSGSEASAGSTGEGGEAEPCVGTPGTRPVGAACSSNQDCASLLCELYSDAPTDTDAQCQGVPDECRTLATGTVRALPSGAPVAGAQAKIAGALEAAITPADAEALGAGTTDAAGRFSILSGSRLEQSVGIVGVTGASSVPCVTRILEADAANLYPPGTDTHELWHVSQATLEAWDDALTMDWEVPQFLPLGSDGAIVGIIRDASTGEPRSGAVLTRPGGPVTTGTQVRYLAADGQTFQATQSGPSGVFVVVRPRLIENLAVEGSSGGPWSVTATREAVSTVAINLP